jgi:hypothetical protein
MNSIWHLARKDMGRYWPLFVLAAGLWAAILWGALHFYGLPEAPPRDFPRESNWAMLVTVLPLAYFIVIFVAPVTLVQEDLVFGDRASWLTRPIQPGALLAAKLCGLLLGLAAPASVLNGAMILLLGAGPGKIAAGMAATAIAVFLCSLFAMVLGALTKTLFQALVVFFSLFFGLILFGLSVSHLPSAPTLFGWIRIWPWPSPFHLSLATETFVRGTVGVVTTLGALAALYRWRRMSRAVGVAIVLCWACSVLGRYWPIDFLSSAADTAFSPLNLDRISVHSKTTSDAKANGASALPDRPIARVEPEGRVQIRIPVHLDGIPPDRFAEAYPGNPVQLDLADGRRIEGQPYATWGHTDPEPAMEAALGLPPSAPRPQPMAITFDLSAQEFAAAKGQDVRAVAKIRLVPHGYQIICRLPLTAGAKIRTKGEAWEVGYIAQPSKGSWTISVYYFGIRPASSSLGFDLQDTALALINTERNEIVLGEADVSGFSNYNKWLCGLNVGEIRLQFRERKRSESSPTTQGLDADWLRHAELCILTRSTGTAVSLPPIETRITIPADARIDPRTPAPIDVEPTATIELP